MARWHRRIDATFRPIDRWPGERTDRPQRSRFRAGWSDTLATLKHELRQIDARDVVIQLAITEDELRLDGYPRANANPDHPGVILAFESKHGPLKYVTDTFDDWQDNIRAIALGLEALRKVDRYGITKRGEQYTGWKALPGGGEATDTMTAEAAAAVVAGRDGLLARTLLRNPDPDTVRVAYREAVKSCHPDRPGGSTAAFQRLQQAKTILDAHHGRA